MTMFLKPKFTPAQQAELMRSRNQEIKRTNDLKRELQAIGRKAARSADLTHTPRGSETWLVEFKRVAEGGRPMRPQAKPLTHRPVIMVVR